MTMHAYAGDRQESLCGLVRRINGSTERNLKGVINPTFLTCRLCLRIYRKRYSGWRYIEAAKYEKEKS